MVIKFEGTFADILDDMYDFLNRISDPVEHATPAPAPAPAAVPVAPPKAYSLDDIMRAAAQLMDAGRMTDLQALLPKYNVVSVNMLTPEKLGAFAADLRALGAKL